MEATLGGLHLNLLGQVGFPLRAGAHPVQQQFEMSTARAEKLLERGQLQFSSGSKRATYQRGGQSPQLGPLTLELSSGNAKVQIQNLYVVAVFPGSDPNKRILLVVDSRWLWRRVFVERSYNIPHITGESHIVSGEVIPLEVAQAGPEIKYRRHSLKDRRTPWTAREVLEDVLTQVCGAGRFEIADTFRATAPVQGIRLRDNGPEALQRVAALLPGADFVPLADGRIRVINTLDQSEIKLAERLQRRAWWGPGWRVVDMSLARPQDLNVYFEREIELRFDYDAATDAATAQAVHTVAVGEEGREELTLEMVVRNPEPELTLHTSKRKVAFGSIIRWGEWLDSITDLADYPAAVGPLTDKLVRRHYLSGLAFLHHIMTLDKGAGTPNVVWDRRLNEVSQSWRRLFRLVPGWREKVRAIKAVRAAILDEVAGIRAQAQCWFDYTVKPSWRALATKGSSELGWEVTSYAADLKAATPAPALVRVVDSEACLLQIIPRLDVYGNSAAIAPGTLDAPVPVSTAGEAVVLWNQVSLDSSWELAVILTVIADQPNDERRLYVEQIEPDDVEAVVDGLGADGTPIGPCKGPTWSVFAGETTSKWAWEDSKASAIKAAVWDGLEMPSELLVNEEEVYGAALAHGGLIWGGLVDRGQGTIAVSLDPTVAPTGNAREVIHGIEIVQTASGARPAMATRVIMPTPVIPSNVWATMPERAREIILRLVQR